MRADVLRLRLARVIDLSTRVAHHHGDFGRLGIEPHIPREVTLARLDAVADDVADLCVALLCVEMELRILRGQVERGSNVVELRRRAA